MTYRGFPGRRMSALVALLCCWVLLNASTVGAFHESINIFSTRRCSIHLNTPLTLTRQSAPFWATRFFDDSPTSQAGSFLEAISKTSLHPSPLTSLDAPFWKPIQDMVLSVFEPLAELEQHTLFATIAANLVSITFWTNLTTALQRFGENMFLALIFVALIQGGIAVFQYRNNPSGELMIPPGPTVGEELPELKSAKYQRTFSSASAISSSLRSGDQISISEDVRSLSKNGDQATSSSSSSSSDTSQNDGSRLLQRVNRLMVILVPWLVGRASFIFQRNSHLLHIGSILTLTSVFDVPQSFLQGLRGRSNSTTSTTIAEDLSLSKGDHEHVIVIGDSLAVGLGTVDRYDRNKTNDIPFRRIENNEETNLQPGGDPGPAFPQAFAKTLAQRLQKRVTWRSAGVDGGDVPNIRKYCLTVIEEEVRQDRVPDVVVLLCGANDMKYFVSNPFQRSNWPRAFRSKLTSLLEEIRELAPYTTIVLPAFPTQMFHRNSPLNVFPLGLLLDSAVGFFDSQKKFVADSFPSEGVFYLGLSPREVGRWYHDNDEQPESVDLFDVQTTMANLLHEIESYDEKNPSADPGSITLIASDGVHPNARCYTKWATAIGEELVAIVSSGEGAVVQ